MSSGIKPRIWVGVVTHVLNPPIRAMFDRLRREAPDDHDVHLILNTDVVVAEAGDEDWLIRMGKADLLREQYVQKCRNEKWEMAGNLDLVFLEAARRAPSYETFWFIEYDVHWEGRWSVFFEHFRDSRAAVIAATMHQIDEIPHKEHFFSYPLTVVPDGVRWERAQFIKAFLPICRVSREALALLAAAYRAGLGGHYEFTVPTVAAQNGLRLEDIGGNGRFVRPDNVNRFYFARGASYTHSPGNFVFRPPQRVLRRPNTLWHPVKPEGVPAWHPMTLGGHPAKALFEWARPFAGRLIIWLWFATRWRPLRQGRAVGAGPA